MITIFLRYGLVVFIFTGFFSTTTFVQAVVSVNTEQSSSSCVFSSNLFVGMTNSDVVRLQRILINRQYLAPDLATGYFGNLTKAAVQRYQRSRSIDTTGFVGPLTRAALAKENCSSLSSIDIPGYFDKDVRISRLSVSSGPVGSFVTITGSGFDPFKNSVLFGSVAVGDIPSADGKTLTFVIPQPRYFCGTSDGCTSSDVYVQSNSGKYTLYVTNSKGISNSSTFTVTATTPTTTTRPSISDTTGPTALRTGIAGVWVLVVKDTISRPLIATVRWNSTDTVQTSKAFSSVAGEIQVLVFTHTYDTIGSKSISFTVSDDNNPSARVSSSARVTVSTSSPARSNTISIRDILPDRVRVGGQVVLEGTGFTPEGNSVHIGVGVIRNISSYNNGSTLFFQIPAYINPCDGIVVGSCNSPLIQTTPGSYNVFVINELGQQTKTSSLSVIK